MSQRVICTKDMFLKIIEHVNEHPYKTAYAIIEKLSNLYLPMDENEYLSMCSDNPLGKQLIRQLIKRPNLNVVLRNNIYDLINTPLADDIYIYDDCPESSKIRSEKGILIINENEVKLLEDISFRHFSTFNFLKKNQKEKLRRQKQRIIEISSWADALSNCRIFPINSAIVIDNYLFHNFERGCCSIIDVLKAIVPKNLKNNFHLTIFVENNKNELKKDKLQKLIDEIHTLELGPQINVRIVAHIDKDATHDRALLTNYHYISSGKGFGIIEDKKVRDCTKGEIMSTLHNICFLSSSSNVKSLHNQLIYWMKDIYKKDGTESVYSFQMGDDFINRLLIE